MSMWKPFLCAVSALLAVAPAAYGQAVGPIVRVSPAGHTVAEFMAATSPINPQIMVATAIDNDQPGSTLLDTIRCAMYASANGGSSWSEVPAWPITTQIKPKHDPWVTISPDGTIHATCIADVAGVGQVVHTRSNDHGVTWSPPTVVNRGSVGSDKSVVAASSDNSVYVCYRRASQLLLSKSIDQGVTWTTRGTGVDAHCNGIIAESSGAITLAVLYAPFTNYGTMTSPDGGTTWPVRHTLGDVGAADSGAQFPSIVRDHTGRTLVTGTEGTNIDITVHNTAGAIVSQGRVPKPPSTRCGNGRILHPVLVGAPGRLPALQVACKLRPTRIKAGYQDVWLYPVIDQPTSPSAPTLVSSVSIPVMKQAPNPDSLAGRMPDGGFFWSFTWRSDGWQSMWVDPRAGNGPGELHTAAVVN